MFRRRLLRKPSSRCARNCPDVTGKPTTTSWLPSARIFAFRYPHGAVSARWNTSVKRPAARGGGNAVSSRCAEFLLFAEFVVEGRGHPVREDGPAKAGYIMDPWNQIFRPRPVLPDDVFACVADQTH